MKSCYEKFFTVPSCTSKKELYGHLLKTLSNAVAYPHTHLLSEDQSGENIRKYRKHQSDTAELK